MAGRQLQHGGLRRHRAPALVSSATKAIYGQDYLAELPVRDYLARMAERPHVQRINADRKTSTAEMLARRK